MPACRRGKGGSRPAVCELPCPPARDECGTHAPTHARWQRVSNQQAQGSSSISSAQERPKAARQGAAATSSPGQGAAASPPGGLPAFAECLPAAGSSPAGGSPRLQLPQRTRMYASTCCALVKSASLQCSSISASYTPSLSCRPSASPCRQAGQAGGHRRWAGSQRQAAAAQAGWLRAAMPESMRERLLTVSAPAAGRSRPPALGGLKQDH